MSELRFDDRVAVITGAGRGLGRAYALLLAARGARIVVNDLGVSLKGEGGDAGPAEDVVREIKAAGGQAIANTDSVATPAGGKAVIQSALDHFGRIDILIHNAGIVRRGSLEELSYEDFERVLDVHLRGGFHVVRPAFPLMAKAGYGRIVMTSSINGLYGNANVVNYSVAKAGLIALSNVAALEGAAKGIKSNAIIPAAVTRMSEGVDTSAFPPMDPERVAPAVAYLAHENCAMTGELLISAAGRVARAFPAESRGVYRSAWTIEDIAANIDAIRSTASPEVFSVVPHGHIDHLRYSFAMTKGSAGK
ncbi:MAG TPA: SDR family NAD(P)-dependent oxidoreductase [Povalibacter sp.]|uniref:SDR family NAD(P)-dependent oxidoreductase n=1 Tax=Povalibacter sp. TaxID=1962978 RepID=UPI002C1E38DA|nr:SDR family NAD(P)-dependent oxidoreductase [Povalibacter sp.]HMN43622.1 SDR family NAD(P)-dependent oxidoreductase [Povalibacter sp.]